MRRLAVGPRRQSARASAKLAVKRELLINCRAHLMRSRLDRRHEAGIDEIGDRLRGSIREADGNGSDMSVPCCMANIGRIMLESAVPFRVECQREIKRPKQPQARFAPEARAMTRGYRKLLKQGRVECGKRARFSISPSPGACWDWGPAAVVKSDAKEISGRMHHPSSSMAAQARMTLRSCLPRRWRWGSRSFRSSTDSPIA